jgi:predicted MPP superfamily phosphohydrolase
MSGRPWWAKRLERNRTILKENLTAARDRLLFRNSVPDIIRRPKPAATMTDIRDSTDRSGPLSDAAALPTLPSITEAGRGPWLQIGGPSHFEWNRIKLPIRGLSPGLAGYRLLHLTDFHLRKRWPLMFEQVHERIRRDPPGLLLLGGDYVEDKTNYVPGLPNVRRLLSGLTYHDGCFGVLGNHDGEIGPHIDGHNMTLIDRKRLLLDVEGGRIELIGLPRLRKQTGPDQPFIDALPAKVPGVPRIILSHYSDYLYRTPKAAPDVFLAGHTHGGQICLPGTIAVMKHTCLPRRMAHGIHRVGETWFVANRGMGYSTVEMRLFCPAEAVEIELAVEKP